MKRLLGLLLVMGIVGCGGGGTSPKSSQAKVDEPSVKSAAADPSVASASVSPKTPADTADDPPAQTVDALPASEAALPPTPN